MCDSQPITILQLTDSHILPSAQDTLMGVNTEFYLQQTFKLAIDNHPHADLIIFSGDLAQEACHSSYQRILEILLSTPIPCICLPGNHDDYALMEQIFNQGNVSCNKQILINNWQIISLNSQVIGKASGFLSTDELNFLELNLNRFPALPKLITVHHHCIPCESQWMDTMQIKNNDELFSLLEKFPQVKAITSGHIHQVLDKKKNGIRIFGTPSTCFQFKPLSQNFALEQTAPGYRWFKLYDDGKLSTGINRLEVKLGELDTQSGGY